MLHEWITLANLSHLALNIICFTVHWLIICGYVNLARTNVNLARTNVNLVRTRKDYMLVTGIYYRSLR